MSTIAGNISEVENISGGNIAEVEAGLAVLALESFLSGEELMVWLANQSLKHDQGWSEKVTASLTKGYLTRTIRVGQWSGGSTSYY